MSIQTSLKPKMLTTKCLLSIIIPVYNEKHRIQYTINHINDLNLNCDHEIIVVDGSPDQSTIRSISEVSVIKLKSPKGRAVQMNTGAMAAKGEMLLFLHADTLLPKQVEQAIVLVYHSTDLVGGAFDLGIRSRKLSLKIVELGAKLRTLVTRIPYGDQAIFIKSDYFRQIGGYREMPLMEDLELMGRIKRNKGKYRIFTSKVKTSPRRWEKEGAVYCTLRNWIIAILFSLGVDVDKLARFYDQS